MANHVLVDFQLANEKLAPNGDHVHISVTGPGIEGDKSADANQFGPPFYLDNLQDGAYTVKLDLLSSDGKPVRSVQLQARRKCRALSLLKKLNAAVSEDANRLRGQLATVPGGDRFGRTLRHMLALVPRVIPPIESRP